MNNENLDEKLSKETLYKTTESLFECLRIWIKFDDDMYNAGLDLSCHPICELYELFQDRVWDLIVDYRGYYALHDEEQSYFGELLYEFLKEKSEFNSIKEIVDVFLTPDFVVNEFDLFDIRGNAVAY